MNEAEEARNKHNINLEIEEFEKKKKAEIKKQNELNRQKKLLAKKKEQERLAKDKAEKERIHAAEVLARKKKLEEDKKRQEKDKRNKQCLKDITSKMNIEANKIKKINWNNVKTEADIERVNRQLATINQLGQKLEPLFKACFEEFGSLKDLYKAKLKKVQEDIIPLFTTAADKMERIVNAKQAKQQKQQQSKPTNNLPPTDGDKCSKYNKNWKPNKTCKLRCPEPETCRDPLCVIPAECKDKGDHPDMKIKRHNNNLPSCPGRICRGSIITGQPADAWTRYEYEGYVLGPHGKLGNYEGWPVVYNYNNKFPWFGMFVKERQAATTDQKKFKRWFDKYLTNHETDGKNNGRSNALRSMRDRHDINIPQKLVEYFPRKFGSGRPDWKGGKKRRKKTRNRKKKKRSTKKKR